MSEPASAGPAAKQNKGGGFADLKVRILSAIVMIVAAVGTLVAGGVAFTLFWLAAAIAICWEWQNLVGGARVRARFYVGGSAIALACSFAAQLQMEFAIAIVMVAAVLMAMLADRGLRLWSGAGVVYAAVLMVMGWQAAEMWLTWRDWSTLAAMLGAVLFMLSDSTLALNKFRAPVAQSDTIIMSTYWAAQLLIAWSVRG